jgi:glutamate-5-semialdehyde dehydrogenase
MKHANALQSGDRVLVGTSLISVDEAFAQSLQPGDTVLGIASTGQLRRIPLEVQELVSQAVSQALEGFRLLQNVSPEQVDAFFALAAARLGDDVVFQNIADANRNDVESAIQKGRSTTRLILSEKMREDMIAAFCMWQSADMSPSTLVDSVEHNGWSVEQWKAPLGVIGFVFEGRPNVFADATGVLKGGNTVVFRIGSDALGTARAIMHHVITPSLKDCSLPLGSVVLLESVEHAAGWSLFSDKRVSLAVARGSGQAVAELGSIAQQAGVAASLHGTGGAWMIVGESVDIERLSAVVEHSLDRKVCNTANVVCVPKSQAQQVLPIVLASAERAAATRGTHARIHSINGASKYFSDPVAIEVHRADGIHQELNITESSENELGHEFEWENNPELFVVVVDSQQHAVELFNQYSPQFVVSVVSEDQTERDFVWQQCNAPFVGDGFTRWVDGQFALLRPELGLSNWQSGRLFARGGVLSGDSAYTIRLRVTQDDSLLHR